MDEGPRTTEEGGVADALRAAIERTLAATAPAAAQTRERAGELVDELARRGQEAGAELAKRGQELTRRGQGAQAELSRQLEALERRMASIEDLLRRGPAAGPEADEPHEPKPKPES